MVKSNNSDPWPRRIGIAVFAVVIIILLLVARTEKTSGWQSVPMTGSPAIMIQKCQVEMGGELIFNPQTDKYQCETES